MSWKPAKSRAAPADYEIGQIRKSGANRIKVALVYPNTYPVGMSNLGFQTVYKQLNQIEHVVCERSFLPQNSPTQNRSIVTLESGQPLSDFDIIAFSISFENDYPNILTILEMANLPFETSQRPASHPLIIAGGVACCLNPEPLAPFIDVFFIGESEPVLAAFFDLFDPGANREKNLKSLVRQIPCLYVPSFYSVSYKSDGTLRTFEPQADVPAKIKRTYVLDLSQFSTDSAIITPRTTFADTFLIETSRGCPHGCRFCCAGFIYRPPRFRTSESILNSLQKGADLTHKFGLVGAAVSNLPEIRELCNRIIQAYPPDDPGHGSHGSDFKISFSSLRADALSPELLELLRKGNVKTVSIAPDAGSERMRRVINKGIDQAAILDAAERLVLNGIPNLKLYFMVGLPTETLSDVDAIVTLCKQVKHLFLKSSQARKRIGEITVSLNSFVPKPFTPFQWVAMDDVRQLKNKIKRVKQGLKRVANVRVHADIPRWANVQGLLARGDRKVARILALAHRNKGNWAKTLKESPVNADFYVLRERALDEFLPWDFIDHGLKSAFLKKEYQEALNGRTSPACPLEKCTLCGVCKEEQSSA